MKEIIHLEISGNCQKKVIIPKTLRDNNWTESIGSIQKKLESLSPGVHEVIFDFTEARWIDPLPLLSLLIEIVSLKRRKINIQVKFPARNNRGPSAQEEKKAVQACPNRVLLYYAKEGFFSALINQSIYATIGGNLLTAEEIEKCERLNGNLAYANSSFIPFKILDIPRIKKISECFHSTEHADCSRKVEEILAGVEVTLRAKCSSKERRQLIYTLSTVIQEFIHNVQEHAYDEGDVCLAAIYVRHRYGKIEICSDAGQQMYEECSRLEKNNCALINTEWLNNKEGCLEVFFLDRGKGILQNFLAVDSKESFKGVMLKTFLNGKSTKKKRRTQNGGLYTLHKLMSRTNDYLRALNESTWFGSSVPLNRKDSRTTQTLNSLSNAVFKGLAYHLRLSWQAPTDSEDSWHRFNADEKNAIRDMLCKTHNECKDLFSAFNDQLVVDERFNEPSSINPDNIQPSYILWLPKRGQMKWDILSRLEDISKHIGTPACLVIADIPSMEAAMYAAAMEKSTFGRREEWPKKFTKILLATNRWTFASAAHVITNIDSGVHGFTTFSTDKLPDNYTSGWKQIVPKGYSLRQMIIYWLKYHESKVFWGLATLDDRLFLPETVVWSDDNGHNPTKIIHGYLDFPATTHNKLCSQLYRLSLARAVEILSVSYCVLEPVDRLAEPVINDLYSQEIYEFPVTVSNPENKFAVGSVLVSGITLGTKDNNQNNIHFFVHDEVYEVIDLNENGEITTTKKITLLEKYPSLFYWHPNITVNKSAFPRQQRIGKTSAIARKGWLSIEIPRVDRTNDKYEKTYAFQSDENSYIDWQNISPTIAKFGHWHYEGHHDLVTLNISDAVEDAFNRRNNLAKFLVQYLLQPLGMAEDEVRHFESVPRINNDLCILIYRSHPSSERIISTVLSALDNDQRKELSQWIFPILPLRQRWGGSTLLIPPREREKIQVALQHRKKAIIFDDAAISGRTIQDLQTTLKALQAEKTEVTVIANRLRLPSESGKINYFWRLDLPIMGRQGVCPWCHALNAAKSLANKMVPEAKEYQDILSWIGIWSKANTINEWHKGLEPIQLKNRVYKNFTYRGKESGDDGSHTQRVPIYRSIGLTIHTLQIHAMTASDDYGLRKIREQDQEPEIKIEIAVGQLMLFVDELDISLILHVIIEGLLNPMVEIENNTAHGQIAVLALMHTLLTSASEPLQKRIVDETKKLSGKLRNLSHGRIYLAFLVSEVLKNTTNSDDAFHSGRRLLSVKHSKRAETLRAFIREMENTAGKIHSEPLPALNSRLASYTDIPYDMLSTAETSIYKLKDILQELGYDLAASDESKSYVDYRSDLEKRLENARKSIVRYSKVAAKNGDEDTPDNNYSKQEYQERNRLKEEIHAITPSFNEVAKCYFHTVDINKDGGKNSFRHELSKVWKAKIDWKDVKEDKNFLDNPIIEHSSDSCSTTQFIGGMEQARILWHGPLRRILQDLICNVAHPVKANKSIQDPWGQTFSDKSAHMWVHISYFQSCVRISLSNHVEDPAQTFEEIKQGTKKKTRWDVLTDEFGGRIQYNDEHSSRKILTIEIYIPYAYKLGVDI